MNCGLRNFTTDDAVWSQGLEADGETIQDLLIEYIQEKTVKEGGMSPDHFNWHWEITYSADPAKLAPYEGKTAAVLADRPEDGHTYVLYSEAYAAAPAEKEINGELEILEIEAYGDYLVGDLPPETLLLTAHPDEEGRLSLTDAQGRYLAAAPGEKLKLTAEPAEKDTVLWDLEETRGGWSLKYDNDSGDTDNALECFRGFYRIYKWQNNSDFIFNFYEVQ